MADMGDDPAVEAEEKLKEWMEQVPFSRKVSSFPECDHSHITLGIHHLSLLSLGHAASLSTPAGFGCALMSGPTASRSDR